MHRQSKIYAFVMVKKCSVDICFLIIPVNRKNYCISFLLSKLWEARARNGPGSILAGGNTGNIEGRCNNCINNNKNCTRQNMPGQKWLILTHQLCI